MRLGFVSSILSSCSFEEVIDFASENGFSCVELACWPSGKVERRYAGVSHLDVEGLDEKKAAAVKNYCREKKVEISALAYYPNMMDRDCPKRRLYADHLKKLIEAAAYLDIGLVTTFAGRIPDMTVEENLEVFQEVWRPLVAFAGKHQVKIGIENCPMLFTRDEWPGGQNLAASPDIWRRMFELIPDANLGLNYDPSHFIWQQMDYIKPVYEFKDRIFHVHFKDIKIFKERLDDVGIMAAPLEYMAPKLPGLGDVDWGKFVSALTDIRYEGCACLEIEDRAFEDSEEDVKRSILLSRNYIRNFVI